MLNKLATLTLITLFLFLASCREDEGENTPVFDSKDYPTEIGQILVTKCATAGCHNDISKEAAGGLSLASWDKLFEGSRGGSPVVPYRPDQSFLMFTINTDESQGVTLAPTMPFNDDALSQEDYETIRDWITAGAPNQYGEIKFADNPDRRKFYVTNQGCDLVSVFDLESKILMRYIDVGNQDAIESPHQIKVSHDKRYWYTIFFSGSVIQKFDASTDQLIGEIEIGTGSWNTFRISADDRYAYIVNWDSNGSVAVVDLEQMELLTTITGNGLLELPHGSLINEAGDILYVTAQHGNFIYKIDLTDLDNPIVNKIALNESSPTTISWLDPHELEFTPDGSKYFATCEASDELRVMNVADDELLAVIPTANFPQEMSMSASVPYLFVTCTEDKDNFPGQTGSVQVFNYNTYELLETIHTGFQPHGIAVDDETGLVYIAHRNVSTDGPAPHHSTDCGGRNGYVTLLDLATFEIVEDYKVEISVDPYSLFVR